MVGGDFPAALGEVARRHGVDAPVETLLSRWRSIVPLDGSWQVVDRLRSAGVRCYLATNQQEYRRAHIAATLGYDDRVDGAYYSCCMSRPREARPGVLPGDPRRPPPRRRRGAVRRRPGRQRRRRPHRRAACRALGPPRRPGRAAPAARPSRARRRRAVRVSAGQETLARAAAIRASGAEPPVRRRSLSGVVGRLGAGPLVALGPLQQRREVEDVRRRCRRAGRRARRTARAPWRS